MANVETLRVKLGKPSVVSQAPVEVKRWGPWQFPHIERLVDGRLHVEYHIEADSATAYGLPRGHATSSDDGMTWQVVKDVEAAGGLLLPNGDRLLSAVLPSRRIEEVDLPEPIGEVRVAYRVAYTYYRATDVPRDLDGWRFYRLPAGQAEWIEETATVRIPGAIRVTTEGVFVFPWFHQYRLLVAPKGSLWSVIHTKRIVAGRLQDKLNVLFLRSTDQGHTWDVLSEILYQPDRVADPQCDEREGFTEPEFNFMPDDSVLCLIRTTDGVGVGPMYWSRSVDNGKTWSEPRVFDDRGVWPQLLTLKNGVTLAAYGRPGLYVRATADPSGLAWATRVAVVEPGKVGTDTCSYSGLLALDGDTALLAYSDFNYPDEQGHKRKTILVRTVTVS